MVVCTRVAPATAAILLRRCAWRLAWRHTTGSRSSGEFMGGPTIRGKRAGQQLAARPAHHVARTLLLQHGVNPNAHDVYYVPQHMPPSRGVPAASPSVRGGSYSAHTPPQQRGKVIGSKSQLFTGVLGYKIGRLSCRRHSCRRRRCVRAPSCCSRCCIVL